MSSITCVIIEEDVFVAEDISATVQQHFPKVQLCVSASFDQARRSMSPTGAPILVIISGTGMITREMTEEDAAGLRTLPVVWIDAPPLVQCDHPGWAFISKPFTLAGLSAALEAASGRSATV